MQLVQSSLPAPTGPRLRRAQWVYEATGLSRSSVYALMKEGRFPKSVRLSARMVAWPESAVLQWVQDRIAGAGSNGDAK